MSDRPRKKFKSLPLDGENLSPDREIVIEGESSHWCDWHDVLLICNSVGLFCVGLILIVVLILIIVWHAHS